MSIPEIILMLSGVKAQACWQLINFEIGISQSGGQRERSTSPQCYVTNKITRPYIGRRHKLFIPSQGLGAVLKYLAKVK